MTELVKNPNKMEKVQAEVREVVGPHGSVSESEERLGSMTRLQAAVKEALRLHPPVPTLLENMPSVKFKSTSCNCSHYF